MANRLRSKDDHVDHGQIDGRARLTLDVTPEMRRRIRLAAAQRDLTIREYIERILEAALPPLRELEVQEGASRLREPITRAAVEQLLATRERIMRGRRFSDDSTELLNEAREERAADL